LLSDAPGIDTGNDTMALAKFVISKQ